MRFKSIITVIVILLFMVSMWIVVPRFTDNASAQSIIIVPEDYPTIQQAVNNAVAGDTIRVWSGTYYENVIVFKRVTLIGNGTGATILNGGLTSDVVRITTSNVILQCFTITSSGTVSTNAGIKLNGAQSCKIQYNNILNNRYGIYLVSSSGHSITGNNFINNTYHANNFGVNTWNSSYPSCGNYWDNYNGSDLFSGPVQDIPGADGVGELPYKNITGSGTPVDHYPLMQPLKPPVGSIIITSHQNGDYVKDTIVIDTVVTTHTPSGVNFYINNELKFFDLKYPFQYILDTSTLPEDSTIQLTAEVVRYSPAVSTTIDLVINNQIQIGDYLAVTTLESSYHPDQHISALITLKSPPAFDTTNLMISYSNPMGYIFYNPNKSLPYDTNYILSIPLPSDSELGFYTLSVTGQGYKGGTLIWSASNITVFMVLGSNIRTKLNSIQASIDEVKTNLSALNSTILNNLTRLDDTLISHLNTTLNSQIQNLTTRLTNEITSMNSSLSSLLTSEHLTLRSWLEFVISELDSNILILDQDFRIMIIDFENRTAENISTLQTNISSALSSLANLELDISELKQLLNGSMDLLDVATLSELVSIVTELSNQVSEFNATLANELFELKTKVTDFQLYLTDKMADIEAALDDLDKINTVLSDLKDLDQSLGDLETARIEEKELKVKDTPQTNLQSFLLIMILIILLFLLYLKIITQKSESKKPTSKKKGQRPQSKKKPPVSPPPPGQQSVIKFFNPDK